jgi:hypothetical protein
MAIIINTSSITAGINEAEQLLQQASSAAREMLEKQENRKAELEADLEKVTNTIMRLKQLVALGSAPDEVAFSSLNTLVKRRQPTWRATSAVAAAAAALAAHTNGGNLEPGTPEEKARADATSLSDMEQVMALVDGPLSVSELKEKIGVMLGRNWAESTLYNHLGKGKVEGRYAHENNRWSLIKGETE